jgi:hypothetical protein
LNEDARKSTGPLLRGHVNEATPTHKNAIRFAIRGFTPPRDVMHPTPSVSKSSFDFIVCECQAMIDDHANDTHLQSKRVAKFPAAAAAAQAH